MAQPRNRQKRVNRLEIERIGGLAGFGGPHLKSRGEVAVSDLSPADRQTVDDLFNHPEKVVQEPRGAGDVFRYRIMRHTAAGAQTIEVPENAVPAALRDSVKDVLE